MIKKLWKSGKIFKECRKEVFLKWVKMNETDHQFFRIYSGWHLLPTLTRKMSAGIVNCRKTVFQAFFFLILNKISYEEWLVYKEPVDYFQNHIWLLTFIKLMWVLLEKRKTYLWKLKAAKHKFFFCLFFENPIDSDIVVIFINFK